MLTLLIWHHTHLYKTGKFSFKIKIKARTPSFVAYISCGIDISTQRIRQEKIHSAWRRWSYLSTENLIICVENLTDSSQNCYYIKKKSPQTLVMLDHACNLSAWKVEIGRSGIQGQFWLQHWIWNKFVLPETPFS